MDKLDDIYSCVPVDLFDIFPGFSIGVKCQMMVATRRGDLRNRGRVGLFKFVYTALQRHICQICELYTVGFFHVAHINVG